MRARNNEFSVQVTSSTLSGNQFQTYQDRSGEIALLNDTKIQTVVAWNVTGVQFMEWNVPNDAQRITVVTNGVLLPMGSLIRLVRFAGGLLTTGYTSRSVIVGANTARITSSIGLLLPDTLATEFATINLIRTGNGTWIMSGNCLKDSNQIIQASGIITLATTLTRIRIQPPTGSFTPGGTIQFYSER